MPLSLVVAVMAQINRTAKFQIGQVVRHRVHPFRGVIFDVDPTFNNTEEWWLSIPEDMRPRKDQPYYHLFAENAETTYVAYVSEQNLLEDKSGGSGSPSRGRVIFWRAQRRLLRHQRQKRALSNAGSAGSSIRRRTRGSNGQYRQPHHHARRWHFFVGFDRVAGTMRSRIAGQRIIRRSTRRPAPQARRAPRLLPTPGSI